MNIHKRRQEEKEDAEAILQDHILNAMSELDEKYGGVPSGVDVTIVPRHTFGESVVQNMFTGVEVQW